MYHTLLHPKICDLHCFVLRKDVEQPLVDCQMTRLTFGVSASSFATNVVMKQNALENVNTHLQAVEAKLNSFYVDNGLTDANLIQEAVGL